MVTTSISHTVVLNFYTWGQLQKIAQKTATHDQGYLELRDAKLNFVCDNSRAIVLKQIYTMNIRLGLC